MLFIAPAAWNCPLMHTHVSNHLLRTQLCYWYVFAKNFMYMYD